MVGVILPVTNNNMVEEVQSHALTSLLQRLRQPIINSTWMSIPTRVVMAECDDCCIVYNRLLHQHPDVHAHLRQPTLAQPYALDELEVLIHQKDM